MWEISGNISSVQVARVNVAPLLCAKAGLGTWHRNIPPAKCTKMTHIYTSLHIHIKHHQASSSYMCSVTHHYNSLYTLRGLCVTSILLCLSPHTADFAPNPRPFAAENMALGEDCVMSRPCSFHPPPQDSGLGHPPSWL